MQTTNHRSMCQLLSLLKYLAYLRKRVSPSLPVYTHLINLSGILNTLHFETEDVHSFLNRDLGRQEKIGEVLERLSVNLNVLDGITGGSERKGNGSINLDGVEARLSSEEEELRDLIIGRARQTARGGFEKALESLGGMLFPPLTSSIFHTVSGVLDHDKSTIAIDMREPDSEISWPHPHPRINNITFLIVIHENYSKFTIPSGSIQIIAESKTSIGEVKGGIRDRVGVPVRQLLLSSRGCILDDG